MGGCGGVTGGGVTSGWVWGCDWWGCGGVTGGDVKALYVYVCGCWGVTGGGYDSVVGGGCGV